MSNVECIHFIKISNRKLNVHYSDNALLISYNYSWLANSFLFLTIPVAAILDTIVNS